MCCSYYQLVSQHCVKRESTVGFEQAAALVFQISKVYQTPVNSPRRFWASFWLTVESLQTVRFMKAVATGCAAKA